MSQEQKQIGLAGLFDEVDSLLSASVSIRDAGYRKWDCHTPYPVHGLDEAMGLKRSPIPLICLVTGFVGVAAALGMQAWMNAVDYPIVIGGKPLLSWPAFVPITFEFFVLFAALTTAACVVVFGRLCRWHSPLHDSNIMAEVTSNRFGLVIDSSDENFDEDHLRKLLLEAGCSDIRVLFESEE